MSKLGLGLDAAIQGQVEVSDGRRTYIGGSDIGAIVGVSKWKTALDVFLEKTGQKVEVSSPMRERIFKRGKRMEPVVLDMLAEEKGLQIVARNERYKDQEYPYMACEIDAETEIDGERVNIEIKTSHPFAADQWGEEGTDEIDVSYAAQAMWGLMITGRSRTIFGVLIGSDNLLTYEIVRDEETIAGMRQRAREFWEQNVLVGIAPSPVNVPDVLTLFGRVPAIRREATPEIAALVDELFRLRGEQRTAEQGEEEVKFKIGEYLLGKDAIVLNAKGQTKPGQAPKGGPHELTLAGMTLLAVGLQTQQRLDGDKVKKEFPEVAAKCVKSLSFYKFAKPSKKDPTAKKAGKSTTPEDVNP